MTDLRLRMPDGHPLQGGYPIVSCSNCGCGFADVVVPASYYENYYRSLAKYAEEMTMYGAENTISAVSASPIEPDWLVNKADDSARRVDALLSSKSARILDVGCATGSVLAALGRLSYEDLHGVDPSPESVRVANTKPGVHANVGTFSALPADLGTFDCICATGVLEHLWDVDEAMRPLHRLLRPEGIVYVEVPDASEYLDCYVSPYEDFNSEHINHFSFSGLRRIAARSGLETVSETSYGAPLTAKVIARYAAVVWKIGKAGNLDETRDEALEATLFAFAARSARDFAEIEDALERDLKGSSEYVLWGIGEMAFKLLALAPLTSRRSIAYVDGNRLRRGFHFDGMAVIAPTAISSSPVPVVVSSMIHADSIVAAIADLGLENPVVRLDRWQNETSTPQ